MNTLLGWITFTIVFLFLFLLSISGILHEWYKNQEKSEDTVTTEKCNYFLNGICLFCGKNCNTPQNKMKKCQETKELINAR